MRYGIWCFISVIMYDEILPNVFDFVLEETRKLIRSFLQLGNCFFVV